jgi:RND family efflux transporter MFP subunit
MGVCAAAAVGCGGPPGAAPATAAAAAATTPAVIDVTTAHAERRDVPTVIRSTGSFVADETSDVTAPVPGTVVATPVDVGGFVQAGDVVLRLDDRDARLKVDQMRASLQQAEAQAQQAKAEKQRNAELAQSGDISRLSYDRLTSQVAVADAAVAQAQAQLAAAEKALNDTVVHAPFAGHVSARPVSVGEYVTTSIKVVTVVRIEPIKLNLQVPESDAARLKVGMAVDVQVPAYERARFVGSIAALNVAIDPNSRTMTVQAVFANRGSQLTPGMFGSAQIRLAATEPAVFVPRAAVTSITNGESSAVYVVDGNAAHVRVVQTAQEPNGMFRVLSGLDGGAIVATSHLDRLFDGAPVRIVETEATTATRGDR